MTSFFRTLCVLCMLTLMVPHPASAELDRADRKAIKKLLKSDVLYMRTDAPCITGRHDFGVFVKPLVSISTEEITIADGQKLNVGFFHTSSTYWGIRINDPVEFDEMDYDDDEATIEIELEGVEQADGERTIIALTGIHTMDDFHKAFDLTFSRQPLQDEHEDWSDEIKRAVAKRQLLDGMNKRQAFYITGEPESVDIEETDGKKYETWLLRTDPGLKTTYGFSMRKKLRDLPSKIVFIDGRLAHKGRQAGELDLDG